GGVRGGKGISKRNIYKKFYFIFFALFLNVFVKKVWGKGAGCIRIKKEKAQKKNQSFLIYNFKQKTTTN
ncbi:hypothetical protein P6709_20175, partial [Jeotgalibacillus sp. ET6]|uniref:hypothetical protein n=1 Tax=Jeotgalibacillus sp. ET6 TaxID=3037260 RepID=UPI00241857AE